MEVVANAAARGWGKAEEKSNTICIVSMETGSLKAELANETIGFFIWAYYFLIFKLGLY